MGDRLGGFTYGVTQPREVYPAYVQGDVRSGVRFNGWTVNLFVNNVANRRGLVNGEKVLSRTMWYSFRHA